MFLNWGWILPPGPYTFLSGFKVSGISGTAPACLICTWRSSVIVLSLLISSYRLATKSFIPSQLKQALALALAYFAATSFESSYCNSLLTFYSSFSSSSGFRFDFLLSWPGLLFATTIEVRLNVRTYVVWSNCSWYSETELRFKLDLMKAFERAVVFRWWTQNVSWS